MNYLPFNLGTATSTKENKFVGGNRETTRGGLDKKLFNQTLVSRLNQTGEIKKLSFNHKQKPYSANSSVKKPELVGEDRTQTKPNYPQNTPESPMNNEKYDSSLKLEKKSVNGSSQEPEETDKENPQTGTDFRKDLLFLLGFIMQTPSHVHSIDQNAATDGSGEDGGAILNQVKQIEQMLKENAELQQILRQVGINPEEFSGEQLKQIFKGNTLSALGVSPLAAEQLKQLLKENDPKWQLWPQAGINPGKSSRGMPVDLSHIPAMGDKLEVSGEKEVWSSNLRLPQPLDSHQVAGSNPINNPEDMPDGSLSFTKDGMMRLMKLEEGNQQVSPNGSATENKGAESILSMVKAECLENSPSIGEGVPGLEEDGLAYAQPSLTKASLIDAKTALTISSRETFRPQDLFQQLVRKAQVMVKEGLSELQIQLKPEFLGKLSLHIAVENGLITARFMAESLQVKQIIEANLSQLKQSLGEQGLQVDRLDVSVGGGSTNQQFGQNQAYYSSNQHNPNQRNANVGLYSESTIEDLKQYESEMSFQWENWSNGGINYLA